jgi:hypothetical protein
MAVRRLLKVPSKPPPSSLFLSPSSAAAAASSHHPFGVRLTSMKSDTKRSTWSGIKVNADLDDHKVELEPVE